jgi:hypothetical protein
MAKFAFGEEKLTIIDAQGRQVDLGLQEAVSLLYWLSDQKATLFRLSRHKNEPKEQLEVHLQEQDLVHLNTLQSAMPQLRERTPATNVFLSPMDAVTRHAIQLLEMFQIEYKIHPLLEDDNAFAQG